MKSFFRFLFVGALLLGAGSAQAGIATTAHDLSSGGSSAFKGTSDQICIYCHTPHNALSTLVPLWNHPTTATASFTLYASSTLNATPGQPDGSSKACLSCHDGTLAADSYASVTGTHPITNASAAYLGTTLANDHPVSFTYDTALATADGGLVSPTSTSLVVTGIPLYNGKMECASCHSVHDATVGKFLRFSNGASVLCLKCHNK